MSNSLRPFDLEPGEGDTDDGFFDDPEVYACACHCDCCQPVEIDGGRCPMCAEACGPDLQV